MKKYLITDPFYYTTTPESFTAALNRSLIKYTPEFVCFRDKSDGDKNDLLRAFSAVCENMGSVSFVNGSLELALKYELDGVHLRGDQINEIKAVKDTGLLCIVSCHSADDVLAALANGCDYVTLSPVYDTPNKGAPIGFETFANIAEALDKTKLFALGGIDDEIKAENIAATGIFGFASIRYFVR
ncbi:MAG: thiamine phosphate synthase [Campylobacterales bacterium]